MSHFPILTFLLLLLHHLTYHRTEARHERRYPELKKHSWHEKDHHERIISPGRHHEQDQHYSTTQSPYDAVLNRLPHYNQNAQDHLSWFFGKKTTNHMNYRHKLTADMEDYELFDDNNDDLEEDYGFSRFRGGKHAQSATTLAPRSLDSRGDSYQSLSDTEDYEYYDDEEDGEKSDELNADRNEQRTSHSFSLTDYKWKNFGTRENVERQFLRQQQHYIRRPYNYEIERQHSDQATAHAKRMSKALRCAVPLARVISVRTEHPHASKSYLPRCTLLHRCGEDSGCCRDDEICAPSKTRRVHLYFHSQSLGSVSNVERLSFVNHTECACMDRRTARTPEAQPELDEESITEPTNHKLTVTPSSAPHESRGIGVVPQGLSRRSAGRVSDEDDDIDDEEKSQREQQDVLRSYSRCRCPSQFSAHLLQDGECQCDCFEGQKDCARIKRGKEYFSMMDRICIQRGDCRLPRCEFGSYKRQSGRCPRRHEKLEAMGRYGTHSFVYN